MSTVTTSSLSDTLPSTVPKLDAEGENWAIFYVRFMDAVEAKGFWGHFDGSSPEPDSSDAQKAEKSQWASDLPTAKTPPVTDDTAQDAPETSDAELLDKRVRKPTKKIADLLGGRGSWSTAAKPALAPGVQQPSDDWTASVSECDDEHAFAAETSSAEALEPWSLSEAKKRSDWPLWEKAIEEELASLKAAGTWEVIDVPKGVNVVGSKWVFRAKKDTAGNVICYKARLVAQGFSQVPGVDYFDTFAPVARLASIRTVLAFAAAEGYETGQIDIKAAYLNGELTENEVIFMKQAPGYEEVGEDGVVKVLRLWKSLYGLKQAGRRCYQGVYNP